jgi:tRNA pseudouridine55 synthase
VRCSRGTYVRTLANDLGDSLGCGAHLVELRRTRSGSFSDDKALELEYLQTRFEEGQLSDILISPLQALAHLPTVTLTEMGAKNVGFGRSPSEVDYETYPEEGIREDQTVCLVHGDKLLAIGSSNPSSMPNNEKTIRLLRVFS